MTNRYQYSVFVFAVFAFATLLVGCDSGPATGRVTGVVSINGTPVVKAVVSFYPSDGRASTGITDESGKYELDYTRNRKGALLGDHKVTIITEILPVDDYGADDNYAQREGDASIDSLKNATRKEMLPVKYRDRKKTDLVATVEKGDNVIDFPISTK